MDEYIKGEAIPNRMMIAPAIRLVFFFSNCLLRLVPAMPATNIPGNVPRPNENINRLPAGAPPLPNDHNNTEYTNAQGNHPQMAPAISPL